MEHSAFAQAVVVNSGIANACTGKQGLDCCVAEAKCAGELLGVPTDAVLVASTGVIGMQIPVDKITAGIEKLVAAKADTLEAPCVVEKLMAQGQESGIMVICGSLQRSVNS